MIGSKVALFTALVVAFVFVVLSFSTSEVNCAPSRNHHVTSYTVDQYGNEKEDDSYENFSFECDLYGECETKCGSRWLVTCVMRRFPNPGANSRYHTPSTCICSRKKKYGKPQKAAAQQLSKLHRSHSSTAEHAQKAPAQHLNKPEEATAQQPSEEAAAQQPSEEAAAQQPSEEAAAQQPSKLHRSHSSTM